MSRAGKYRCFYLLCLAGIMGMWFFYLAPVIAGKDVNVLDGEWKYFCYHVQNEDEASEYVQMSYDDEHWQVFQAGEGLDFATDDANCVQYATRLPSHLDYVNPVLFLVTYNEAVRVFCDNQMIYSRGEFLAADQVYGTRWHVIVFSNDYQEKQLTIQLFSNNKDELGRMSHVSLDEARTQMQKLLYHDAMSIALIALVLLVILMMVQVFLIDGRENGRYFIWLIAYLAIWVLFSVSGLWIVVLVLDKPAVWYYVFHAAFFLQPVPIGVLVYSVVDITGKKLVSIFQAGNLVFLLVAIAGEIVGRDFFASLGYAQYLWAAGGNLMEAILLLRCKKTEDSMNRHYSLVLFVMFVFSVQDRVLREFNVILSPFMSSNITVLPILVYVLWRIHDIMEREYRLHLEVKRELKVEKFRSQIDPLTKCFVRSRLEQVIQGAIRLAEGGSVPFCVLMIDIDKFKSVNDTYGHAAGDKVLQGVAEVLRTNLGLSNTLVRYGGEEFMAVCVMHTIAKAKKLAERIRCNVEKAVMIEGRQITCSIGISYWHIRSGDTAEAVQKRADDALYFAKAHGRNRCVTEDEM